MNQPTVFISYSHEDEDEKDKLLSHLGVLQHAGLIDVWSDDRILAGANREEEIDQAIAKAKVAILLISANYLSSEFILGKVHKLLKRREHEGITVIPVIAKACAWRQIDWLAKMAVRPKNGKPVWSGAGNHVDEELTAIAEEVAAILKTRSDFERDNLKECRNEILAKPAGSSQNFISALLRKCKLLLEGCSESLKKFKLTFIILVIIIAVICFHQKEQLKIHNILNPLTNGKQNKYNSWTEPLTRIEFVQVPKRGFWIGRYEVTQKQWDLVMDYNPSSFKHDDYPVERVSWNDVKEFIRMLNENNQSGRSFRLPTEAEWEYACQYQVNGTGKKKFDTDQMAWHSSNSGKSTHPVGKKRFNALYLHDMIGNVQEWCEDDIDDVFGRGKGLIRVVRGGSWACSETDAGCGYRLGLSSDERSSDTGFRLVMVAQ
ncbi:MAG: SUMF1/EgtB/PvdO family nonheme iron enzyme [Desulfobacterales bacterium]|nr:SUMF1/EgtB/PvdO family nonheme iron enzyme [Desulfobacterales bacterium]